MRASKLLVDSLLPATTRWDLLHLRCLVYMSLDVFVFLVAVVVIFVLDSARTAGGGGSVA